jgi:hypothetical protein
VIFDHGLGDCVYFAHQLPLYRRRGYNIEVACRPDKDLLFHAANVPVTANTQDCAAIPWLEGELPNAELRFDNYWRWSKMARNLSRRPMPDIGDAASLWQEYCDVTLAVENVLPARAADTVGQYISRLDKPLVVLHAQGTTARARKDIPNPILHEIVWQILAQTDAVILLLDWHASVPPWPHWRVRHVQYDFGTLDTAQLLSLLDRAALVIGIDSGPLHAARYTNTPSIGVWMRDGSPATWSLPRARQVNIVVGLESQRWTRTVRLPFNILECDSPALLPALLGRTAASVLAGHRYLPPSRLGRDVLLQHLVQDLHRRRDSPFGAFNDCGHGFDRLFTEAARDFKQGVLLQTASRPYRDDGRINNHATLLLGIFAEGHAGDFISVSQNPGFCQAARQTVACLGKRAAVIEMDPLAWLSRTARNIDILYLDGGDSSCPGCAVHTLDEIQAADNLLHITSIVVFNNTSYSNGTFIGSGALGVPWLQERGWRILHSGQQTMLRRAGN